MPLFNALGPLIAVLTGKTTPTGADTLVIADSEAGNTGAGLTLTNLAAWLAALVLTWTNKTFDTAGAGNSLSINGVAVTANTGTGAVVRDTSPILVTPNLGVATVTSINKVTITQPAAGATLTIPNGVTLTGPAASGTAMTLGNAESVTGAKTFGDAKLLLAGATSGTTTLKSGAVAGTSVITLPVATDTLVGKATTDTLTNKTFDTAGAGNSLSINGLAATANSGTGSVVRATSPSLATPTVTGLMTLTGGQVAFPATQVPSADANTLDDYEEGTFTPSIAGTTTAGTATYGGGRVGTYTKKGREVTAQIYMNWSGHTGTGSMKITGLPFTCNSDIHSAYVGLCNNLTLTANNILTGYITGSTEVTLQQSPVGGGGATSPAMNASGQLAVEAIYFV